VVGSRGFLGFRTTHICCLATALPHYHHTHTFSDTEIALQNERIQWQDCIAFMLIRDAAICITVLSDDLRQNRLPCGADEHYVHPRGKHGCAVKFHFSESEQNVLPRVQGIQVAVPHNTITHTTTQ
jgi:hypothetical protein